MDINALPKYDMSDNPTHCCLRFNTDGWDRMRTNSSVLSTSLCQIICI